MGSKEYGLDISVPIGNENKMNNKENHPYRNWLEDPSLSKALDKIIQESRERLKQKRHYQNKGDDNQNYNRGNNQNDDTNSGDYIYYDYIVSSCE